MNIIHFILLKIFPSSIYCSATQNVLIRSCINVLMRKGGHSHCILRSPLPLT